MLPISGAAVLKQQRRPPMQGTVFDMCENRIIVAGDQGTEGSPPVRRLVADGCEMVRAYRATIDPTSRTAVDQS